MVKMINDAIEYPKEYNIFISSVIGAIGGCVVLCKLEVALTCCTVSFVRKRTTTLSNLLSWYFEKVSNSNVMQFEVKISNQMINIYLFN